MAKEIDVEEKDTSDWSFIDGDSLRLIFYPTLAALLASAIGENEAQRIRDKRVAY